MYRQYSTATLLLLAAFAAHPSSAAAISLTLDESVGRAEQTSPALQKMEAARSEANWKNIEGFSVFLPTVQVDANHYFATRYEYLNLPFNGVPISFPQIFPTSAATLNVNWLLFDGFSNVNRYRSTNHLKKAAENEYLAAQFQLAQDVRLAYMRVVAAKKLNDVAQQNLKTLQNHLEQNKMLKTGGVSTNYDVLRVESQLSEAQAELLESEDNIAISQERLGQTIGLSDAVDSKDMEMGPPAASAQIKTLEFNRENNKRVDLQALQDRAYAGDLSDSASNLFWVPKISVGGQYTLYNNLTDSLSDWDRYRAGWGAGFFLTWDIFNPSLYAKSKQEQYSAIQTEKSLQQANLAAPVDFAFWKKRYLYSATLYEAKIVDLDRAQETLRLAQAGFKAGVRTTTEVLDAELDLFRARAGIVNAQMNCTEAKIKLELALGETI